jgi:hypothetical protein
MRARVPLCNIRYQLLGDDIVINNDDAAQKYDELMVALGVDISKPKTHTSKNFYEFAKRWYRVTPRETGGVEYTEVSGSPINGYLTIGRN